MQAHQRFGQKQSGGQAHPEERILALYSRRDLGWRDRIRLSRHVKICAECSAVLEQFQVATADVQREATAGTLTGFEAIADWKTLEGEMLGNIRVGLDAARCIDHVGRRRVAGWRLASVSLGLFFMVILGWVLNTPLSHTAGLMSRLRTMGRNAPLQGGPVVSTTPSGIEVKSTGGSLTLLSPSTMPVSVLVSGASAVTASYVDAETGQVTITNVYGQ
jgi:hypothetical protein